MPLHSLVLVTAGLLPAADAPKGDSTRPDKVFDRVEPLTLEDTILDAAAVFVGRLEKAEPRRSGGPKRTIVTDYTFEVEDALLPLEEVQNGRKVTLTFWGGTVGKQSQGTADRPNLKVGRRYILMLRGNWKAPGISPLVGIYQGLFAVVKDPKLGDDEYVVDSEGKPLYVTRRREIVKYRQAEAGARPGIAFGDFIRTLRQGVSEIQGASPANVESPRLKSR